MRENVYPFDLIFFFCEKNVTQPGIMSCKVSKQMNACCSDSMFTALILVKSKII